MLYLSEPLTAWQRSWREGIAPQLSTDGLRALNRALERDDLRLIQGATTAPPPLQVMQEYPVEGACAVWFAGWKGDGLSTVAQVEEHFARVCYNADVALGEPAGARHFLVWFDETPREAMRPLLLEEVKLALALRAAETKGGERS